jgi:transaldolase
MMNIKLNITVLMTIKHVNIAFDSIKNKNIPTIFSVFSGRIADTGVNPRNICLFTAELIKNTNIELLWASTREIFNICQAIEYGCHIITIPDDILDKYGNLGKNLDLCCLETVRKFYEDGQKCTIKF